MHPFQCLHIIVVTVITTFNITLTIWDILSLFAIFNMTKIRRYLPDKTKNILMS